MRLFGNVLGSFIIMELIKLAMPAIVPMALSMYFDVFDGIIQTIVFVFLTALFTQEALEEPGCHPSGPRIHNPNHELKKKERFIMSIAIGAAIAVLTGIGAGIGIGLATAKATDAIARQPEAADKIQRSLLIGCALAEATAIYGLVIGIMIILFVK